METNVNYTIVGAFVITLMSLTILGIIWLSSGFSFQHYTTYMLLMQESVTGLTIDSPVEYNGVDVGAVKNIALNQTNPRWVEVLLKIKSDTPITQGTIATITSRGITGITYIALKDKSLDLRPIVKLPDQPYPIIKTGPSLFSRLDSALSELSANFKEVASAIQHLLNPANQNSIKNILENLQQVTGVLSANSRQLTAILRDTSQATQQLPLLLQSSTTAARMLQTQTLPATYNLLSNLNDVARNLNDISLQIKQNPAVLIRGSTQRTLGPGESR